MINKFVHAINLVELNVLNSEEEEFRDTLNNIPYLLYEVEKISNGNKIAINKPGGKRNWRILSREDYMVFIVLTASNELWMISHNELYEDIQKKCNVNFDEAINLIDSLLDVCNGCEPDDVMIERNLSDVIDDGLDCETILKVYKCIWGQEDCNYPKGKGRWLSMNAILELKNRMIN